MHNIKKSPLVYFYVNQQKPDCLLIATADGNTISDDKFYTAACYPVADLQLISIENIVEIRIFEIIFFFKRSFVQRTQFWLVMSIKKYSNTRFFNRQKSYDEGESNSTVKHVK